MPPKKKRGLPPGALHHVERKHFKVLFCGKEFPAGAEETRKALEKHDAVGNCEFRFVACARDHDPLAEDCLQAGGSAAAAGTWKAPAADRLDVDAGHA